MNISFATTKLERQLTSEREMQKAYGHVIGALKLRISELWAVARLADVPHSPPPRRHQLTGDWAGHFAVSLTKNYRLIFKPDHDPVPTLPDGGFDLNAITAVMIVKIEDYHGT